MSKQFTLEIITPDRLFFDGKIDELIFNTPTGEVEILYHTLPMVAIVAPGIINISQNGRKMEAACSEGFVRVADRVTLLVQTCKWPYEVDEEETNREVKLLNDKIKKAQSMKEYKMAKAQLALQLAKLKAKEMKY